MGQGSKQKAGLLRDNDKEGMKTLEEKENKRAREGEGERKGADTEGGLLLSRFALIPYRSV